MTSTLHIVCLDAPSPPDYGGAIDMYYKIESLVATGTRVILHYFDYKKDRNLKILTNLCHEVHAYKRKSNFFQHCSPMPYIVSSRINTDLIKRLNLDDFPILFEGLHTTGIMPYLINSKRKLLVRMHNNEANYYGQLAKSETNLFRRLYYKIESRKITKYHTQLNKSIPLLCISTSDIVEFKQMGFTKTYYLPAFIPFSNVSIEIGTGNYCLYHGNLSIAENREVVLWLIRKVFSKINIPFIIAGRKITKEIKASLKPFKNISFADDPSNEELEELIKKAQIHVLPSFNKTGIKLKLIHALLRGKHCIVNPEGVEGSSLEPYCHIANTTTELKEITQILMAQPFKYEEIEKRKEILRIYNNRKNADLINAYLQ